MNENRVTLESIESKIASEHYTVLEGSTVTICRLTMQNGYSVVGKSACADPANFNEQKGREYAREDAIEQLWPLEGYLLREKMHARENAPTWCDQAAQPTIVYCANGDIVVVDQLSASVLVTVSAPSRSGVDVRGFLRSLGANLVV